jgi:hypothetical protein
MRDLTLRGLDAWITREPESSEPWGECECCASRYARIKMFTLDGVLVCADCARDMEPPDA